MDKCQRILLPIIRQVINITNNVNFSCFFTEPCGLCEVESIDQSNLVQFLSLWGHRRLSIRQSRPCAPKLDLFDEWRASLQSPNDVRTDLGQGLIWRGANFHRFPAVIDDNWHLIRHVLP